MPVNLVSYRPEPSEFAWTFGGVKPVQSAKPGDVLELWTEDAFGGKVRGPEDLVTKVIEFPFVNPQTGPFYIEGAEPGDTLAVHFVSIEPSRDWAASSSGRAEPVDIRYSSFSRRGHGVGCPLIRSITHTVSMAASTATPQVSPSPCRQWPSPIENSAPSTFTPR